MIFSHIGVLVEVDVRYIRHLMCHTNTRQKTCTLEDSKMPTQNEVWQALLSAFPEPKTTGAPSTPALSGKTPSPLPSPESICSLTDSRRMKPSPQLKHGRTLYLQLAETRHNLKKRIGDLLAEPLIRDLLYWLLYICLAVEEYLIRLLLED